MPMCWQRSQIGRDNACDNRAVGLEPPLPNDSTHGSDSSHCYGAFVDEETKNALASSNFRCLRNYGDRWGISHLSFDRESIAEIFNADFDQLLEAWVNLNDAINNHREERGEFL